MLIYNKIADLIVEAHNSGVRKDVMDELYRAMKVIIAAMNDDCNEVEMDIYWADKVVEAVRDNEDVNEIKKYIGAMVVAFGG